MAGEEILYVGGEIETLSLVSGGFVVSTNSAYFEDQYSACALSLLSNTYRFNLKSTPEQGDTVWFKGVFAVTSSSLGSQAARMTIYDKNGRAAFRLEFGETAPNLTLSHNTSISGTTWATLIQTNLGVDRKHIDFSVTIGPTLLASLYAAEIEVGSATFTNTLIDDLSYGQLSAASSGAGRGNAYASQILARKNRTTVRCKVVTRKPNAIGTYSQMTGGPSNLAKTALNDTTGVSSDTAGQLTTNNYQDITVPDGMEMDGDVWLWSRAANDGGEPSTMKHAALIDSSLVKTDNLNVTPTFTALPSVFSGMTAEKFNAAEFGMESSTT